MKKGVENTIGNILLGVAALILLGFLAWKFVAWANEKIQAQNLIGGPESLINAIRCSYYRCVEGCSSNKLNILIDGQNCNKTFCAPYIIDDGFAVFDKICDENAREHPIPITLDYETKITKGNFEWLKDGKSRIIKEPSDCMSNSFSITYPSSIYIKESSIKDSSLDDPRMVFLGSVTIKPDNYYIYTTGGNTFIWDSKCGKLPEESLKKCCNNNALKDAYSYCRNSRTLNLGENDMCLTMTLDDSTVLKNGRVDSGTFTCPKKGDGSQSVITDIKAIGVVVKSPNIFEVYYSNNLKKYIPTVSGKTGMLVFPLSGIEESIKFVFNTEGKIATNNINSIVGTSVNVISITCG